MLPVILITLAVCGVGYSDKIKDEALAWEWANENHVQYQLVAYQNALAIWAFQTNITDHNNKIMIAAGLKKAEFEKETYKNASMFDWRNFKNATLRRLFSRYADIGTAVLQNDKYEKFRSVLSEMQNIFAKARACDRPGDKEKKCYTISQLVGIMRTSRDPEQLEWSWRTWADVTGTKVKPLYEQYVDYMNEAARMGGYRDAGDYWRSNYDMEDFSDEVVRLWEQVRPLYVELHTYLRRKLREQYTNYTFPETGHIPANFLGNVMGYYLGPRDIAQPFKDKKPHDVTQAMIDQGYNASAMFGLGEHFFESLGMMSLPEHFFRDSLIENPNDGRALVCGASAWDLENGEDFRMKMCTRVSQSHLITVHHELGHIQYFQQYRHLHYKLRTGANNGFHEAIGDVIMLSVITPKYLNMIGLLANVTEDLESDLNFLMSQAVLRVGLLPFALSLDMWRWSVFSGKTKKQQYNEDFWKLRCKLQGVAPPVQRPIDGMDAAGIFHVPNDFTYIRYFISYVLQFQFHEALCRVSGNTAPLHQCSIYGSKAAGEKFSNMMRLGASKPWPDALEQLTGTRQMDARPMLEYFRPLMDWLREQNKGETRGWDSSCPPGSYETMPPPTEPSTFGPTEPSSASGFNVNLFGMCTLILLIQVTF